ncbi:HNH endonuclease [Streptomyces sp. NPDC088115]|uniref:HNH endonuclease n=1 Tax=Streptomyces sp. NPDC088115 TaxID=3365824 RepID=UPI003823410D
MTTTDYPIDPQLVAAVNEIFHRYKVELIRLPKQWRTPCAMRKGLNTKRATAKRKRLVHMYGLKCTYCGCSFEDIAQATLDHVVPYRLLRSWANVNLALACADCNEQKDDKVPAVLMPLLTALVLNQVRLNASQVERSLVLKAVA